MSCRGSREANAIAKLNTMAAEARVAVTTDRSARVDRVTPEISTEESIAIGPKAAWDEERPSLLILHQEPTRTDMPPVIWMYGQTPVHFLRCGQHAALPEPRQVARADCSGEASFAGSVAGPGAAHQAGIRRRIGQRQNRSRFLVDFS